MSPATAETGGARRPLRPRPPITADNAYFFEGVRRGELLVQRCTGCGVLRHPPEPVCAACRSYDWDTVEASGRGEVYSYTVNHYPRAAAFDYPLLVALVELEEGVRIVSNLVGVAPADVRVGMPVEVEYVECDPELVLPMFRPAADGAGIGAGAPGGGPTGPGGAGAGPGAVKGDG